MNTDIYYLLLKEQQKVYESRIKELKDRLIPLDAEEYLQLADNQRCEDTYYARHRLRLCKIEELIKEKCDKRIILHMLKLMRRNHRGFALTRNGMPGFYMSYDNIRSIICDMDSGYCRNDYTKKVVSDLYEYMGEDFCTQEELKRVLS